MNKIFIGLITLKTLTIDKESEIAGKRLNIPVKQTNKSNTFQGSFRYVFSPKTKPNAITFSKNSMK